MIPSSIASNVVQPLNEKAFCDFCCKPLTTAFQLGCNHVYCGECILAIAQQENVEIPTDILKSAAESAYQDKPVVITTEQLTQSQQQAVSMTQQAQQLPQMSCPLCLRIIERMTAINPNRRQQSRLCQECGVNERVVRCSACACELCAECDAKIHSFATTKGHQRTPIANAGNVSGMLVQLPCQSPSHKTVVAEAMLKGVQTTTLAHPLYTETTQ